MMIATNTVMIPSSHIGGRRSCLLLDPLLSVSVTISLLEPDTTELGVPSVTVVLLGDKTWFVSGDLCWASNFLS